MCYPLSALSLWCRLPALSLWCRLPLPLRQSTPWQLATVRSTQCQQPQTSGHGPSAPTRQLAPSVPESATQTMAVQTRQRSHVCPTPNTATKGSWSAVSGSCRPIEYLHKACNPFACRRVNLEAHGTKQGALSCERGGNCVHKAVLLHQRVPVCIRDCWSSPWFVQQSGWHPLCSYDTDVCVCTEADCACARVLLLPPCSLQALHAGNHHQQYVGRMQPGQRGRHLCGYLPGWHLWPACVSLRQQQHLRGSYRPLLACPW